MSASTTTDGYRNLVQEVKDVKKSRKKNLNRNWFMKHYDVVEQKLIASVDKAGTTVKY